MNAIDVLKYGHETVLKSIDGLPETEWETAGVCGIWSVKDIMAHLTSYEHLLVDILNMFLGQEPGPHLTQLMADGEQFNDKQVATYKDKISDYVLSEYCITQEKALSLVAQIPAETLRQPGTLPNYGPEYALDDMLVYSYYGHKREHCAQIAVFRDRLANLAGEKTRK